MKIIFLDIDGVLNNCISTGVFHGSSTKEECVNILNEAIQKTESKVIIISTWKDSYDFETIKKLLYNRGILKDSIIGCTEKDTLKEDGITNYLNLNNVEKFVIVDDNLSFKNIRYENFYVKSNSYKRLGQMMTPDRSMTNTKLVCNYASNKRSCSTDFLSAEHPQSGICNALEPLVLSCKHFFCKNSLPKNQEPYINI